MPDKFEKLFKLVFKSWKLNHTQKAVEHPDEEILVSFIEGRLSEEESTLLKEHLIACEMCAEAVALNLSSGGGETREVPDELLTKVKSSLVVKNDPSILEIILQLKEKTLELINTTGDVLVGLELVPAPILRSRSIKDFKDEITILKDFQDIRIEAKIENKGGQVFNLNILIKQKQTQKTIKDLRVSLIKDNLELESYLTDSGTVIFEHVSYGKYIVEVSTVDSKVASILLDVKV